MCMCTFLFWMEHCGIWNKCILGFVKLFYYIVWYDHVVFCYRLCPMSILPVTLCGATFLRCLLGTETVHDRLLTGLHGQYGLVRAEPLPQLSLRTSLQVPLKVRINTMIFNYSDVIMSTMASQITGVSSVCSTVCSGTGQIKLQRSASLAFVRGINRRPVNSPNKGTVARKMFPFDDVIMFSECPK